MAIALSAASKIASGTSNPSALAALMLTATSVRDQGQSDSRDGHSAAWLSDRNSNFLRAGVSFLRHLGRGRQRFFTSGIERRQVEPLIIGQGLPVHRHVEVEAARHGIASPKPLAGLAP